MISIFKKFKGAKNEIVGEEAQPPAEIALETEPTPQQPAETADALLHKLNLKSLALKRKSHRLAGQIMRGKKWIALEKKNIVAQRKRVIEETKTEDKPLSQEEKLSFLLKEIGKQKALLEWDQVRLTAIQGSLFGYVVLGQDFFTPQRILQAKTILRKQQEDSKTGAMPSDQGAEPKPTADLKTKIGALQEELKTAQKKGEALEHEISSLKEKKLQLLRQIEENRNTNVRIRTAVSFISLAAAQNFHISIQEQMKLFAAELNEEFFDVKLKMGKFRQVANSKARLEIEGTLIFGPKNPKKLLLRVESYNIRFHGPVISIKDAEGKDGTRFYYIGKPDDRRSWALCFDERWYAGKDGVAKAQAVWAAQTAETCRKVEWFLEPMKDRMSLDWFPAQLREAMSSYPVIEFIKKLMSPEHVSAQDLLDFEQLRKEKLLQDAVAEKEADQYPENYSNDFEREIRRIFEENKVGRKPPSKASRPVKASPNAKERNPHLPILRR